MTYVVQQSEHTSKQTLKAQLSLRMTIVHFL